MASQLVILVHGTFANSAFDRGAEWWQNDSSFHRTLKERLPPGIRLSEEYEVFHWSGANTEWDRWQAAERLLRRLYELQTAGVFFHLVGHSHGGSIIRQALRASLKREPLRNLASWTTVGTPFLNYAPAKNLVGVLHAFVLRPICYLALAFCICFTIALLYVSIEGVTAGENIATSVCALCALLLAMVISASYVAGFAHSERGEVRKERKADSKFVSAYGSCWLGLFHPHDEAITGLRASMAFHFAIMPRVGPTRLRVGAVGALLHFPRVTIRAVAWRPLFNWMLAPVSDRFILNSLRRSFQGNTRTGCELRQVAPTILGEIPVDLALPEFICQKLTTDANAFAAERVSTMRELFGIIAAGGLILPGFSGDQLFSGRELIHTSYFWNPDVIELIAMHIELHSGNPLAIVDRSAELAEWYHSTHRQMAAVAQFQSSHCPRTVRSIIRRRISFDSQQVDKVERPLIRQK